MTTQLYRIRPGRRSDLTQAVEIYEQSFSHDALIDILFPNRHEHPEALRTFIRRLFMERWWNPHFDLDVLMSTTANDPLIVGFTWWKRPDSQLSFYERWVSPYAWLSPIVLAILSVRDWLFPIPHLDKHASSTFTRSFTDVEPRILSTPRRKSAWYLSILGVRPTVQGKGLGTTLMLHGLRRVDQAGAAAWLIGLKGVEGYYEKHGFVEVARANVGELEHWGGGAVMFRNE